MGGSTESTQSSRSQTQPWAPSIPVLQGILGQAGGLLGNSAPTGNENQAFNALTANAQAGNPFAGQIGQLTTDLLSGGTNRGGIAQDAYDNYRAMLTPFARGDYVDPTSNPALGKYLDVIRNDVTNNINSQFAAAGRDLSGMNTQALARGIAQGEAPVLLDAYNADLNRQLGAGSNLYGAGNNTAGLLSNFDQTALANRQAGIGASTAAQQARDAGANQLLAIEAQRRGIPLQNLTALAGIATPIAHLGSQTDATTTASQTVPLGQQILGGAKTLFGGLADLGKAGAFGPSGWLLSGSNMLGSLLPGLSDARVKEDIAPVGALYDGSPVYSFRYTGDPATRIGLIAQEVESRHPEAVQEVGGVKAVDYRQATAKARALGGLLQKLAR